MLQNVVIKLLNHDSGPPTFLAVPPRSDVYTLHVLGEGGEGRKVIY